MKVDNQIRKVYRSLKRRNVFTILGDSMYIVADGDVEVSKTLTMKAGEGNFTKGEKTLKRFKAEDIVVFGEIAMIDRENRSA